MVTLHKKLVVDNTPWEVYDVDGVDVHVKREDLCCPLPGPSFSKIRGVASHLGRIIMDQGITTIGVMDTQHSKAGWGVSYLCNKIGDLRCWDFYPVLKSDTGLRENQRMAKQLGARLYPLKAGMSAVLYNQAKKILREEVVGGYMLPNALKLDESVDATHAEFLRSTPKELIAGTWVVSISSGTIASGLVRALSGTKATLIAHMGYDRSEDEALKYMYTKAKSCNGDVRLVNEHYEYKDKVDTSWIPFPCNEYYDAKAFWWLATHIHELIQPIIFWNIGA